MKKRRVLSILLCICLLFSAVQMEAFASQASGNIIANSEINSLLTTIRSVGLTAEIDETNSNIINVSGTVERLEEPFGFLTLTIPAGVTVKWSANLTALSERNYPLINVCGSGIFEVLSGGSVINLSGYSNPTIYLHDSVTLRSSGDIKGYWPIDISEGATASVYIDGGNVEGEAYGISNNGTVDAKIYVTGGKVSSDRNYAIQATHKTVVLSGTASVECETAVGISAKTLNVVSGTPTIRSSSDGIRGPENSQIMVADGAVLRVVSSSGYGIDLTAGTITVNGHLDVEGQSYGINRENGKTMTININGGALKAVGNSAGIRANATVNIINGDYYSYNGNAAPSGSNVYQFNELPSGGKHIELISAAHLTNKTDNQNGTHTLSCNCNGSTKTTITENHRYGYDVATGNCICGAEPAIKTATNGDGISAVAYYGILSEALTAVNDSTFNGTLKLLKDATVGVNDKITNANVTLDLNGKTLTGTLDVAGITLLGNSGGKSDFLIHSGAPIKVDNAATGTYSAVLKDASGNNVSGTFATAADNESLETGWFTPSNTDYAVVKDDAQLALKKKLELASVTIAPVSDNYNGAPQTPDVTVTWKGETLIQGTDYDLSWNEALLNAGTYTATITGKGAYTGTKTEGTYTINQIAPEYTVPTELTASYGQPLSTVSIPSGADSGSWSWKMSSDKAGNIGEHKHVAIFTPNDTTNYICAEEEISLVVSVADLSTGTIAAIADQTYSGEAITPTVTVIDSFGNTLTQDVEYTVQYSDHTDAGTATVTVLGKDNYTGTLTKTFTITPKAVTPTIEGVENAYTYTGEAIQPEVTVKDGATVLTEGTDYTVTYGANKNVSDGGSVTVTLTGNYSGSAEKNFVINKKQLTWDVSELTASKPQGNTEEAIVYGQLKISGIYNNEVSDTPPANVLLTSGFASQTAAGSYTVSVVSASGNWGFATEPDNYLWPTGDPSMTASVHAVEELATPPEMSASGDFLKVEMENGISAVPAAFARNENLNTPQKIKAVLKTELEQINANIPSANQAVYDVTLMVSMDDGQTWIKADANHWPASGKLTVTLPYPDGTGKNTHNFTVVHMFTTNDFGKTPGDTENPRVTKTDAGIQFQVTGLSPIMLGWTEVVKSGSSSSDDDDDSSENTAQPIYRTGEYEFWMAVKSRLETVKDGTELNVSAGTYSRMPIAVMNALKARADVILSINWTDGKAIEIPSKLAPTPESERIYYELSELAIVFPKKEQTSVAPAVKPIESDKGKTETTVEESVTETETTEKAEVSEETEKPETDKSEVTISEIDQEEEKNGMDWMLVLLIVLAILFFVILGFLLYLLSKRKKRK